MNNSLIWIGVAPQKTSEYELGIRAYPILIKEKMTIKKLCKDNHYRWFEERQYRGSNIAKTSIKIRLVCQHCGRRTNYLRVKSHTCKARVKELNERKRTY